jgi:uncharacterized membrane protein YbhN (UPF0104 family)
LKNPEPQIQTASSGALWKQTLKMLFIFLLTGALVYYILRYQIKDPKEVWSSITHAALLPLIIFIPLSLLSHLVRAWRWRRFIGQPVSLFYSFTSVMIGYAVNDVLPRVGEVARVVNMNRMTRVPIAKLLTTLVAERILDVLALVFLLGISFLLEGDRITEQIPWLSQAGRFAMLFGGLGLFCMIGIAFFSEPICRLAGAAGRRVHTGLGNKTETLVRQGAEGLAFLKRPGQAVWVLLETAGIWGLYLITFMLGLASFGLFEGVGYSGATVSFSVTSMGILVPTVGSIGAYHEAGRLSLTEIFNVDSDRALACITVIHALAFYLVGGVFGILAWGLQVFMRRRVRTKEEPE